MNTDSLVLRNTFAPLVILNENIISVAGAPCATLSAKTLINIFVAVVKPPYVCNGCGKRAACSLEKCFYKAQEAHSEYKQILTESRSGISLMMDHINSYCRESLGNKSPYEMFAFLYGDELLDLLECHQIPPQEVTLKKSVDYQVNLEELHEMEDCVPMTRSERHALRKWVHDGNNVESNPWDYRDGDATQLNFLQAFRLEYGYSSGPWDYWKGPDSQPLWDDELKCFLSKDDYC